jgi:hypothetical protein
MADHLTLGVWPLPVDGGKLKDVEDAVIDTLQPPLNITGVKHPLDALVLGRKLLADEARNWQGSSL